MKYFSTEKNYLDLKSKGGEKDEEEEQTPDGQYRPIWALLTSRLGCTDMAG